MLLNKDVAVEMTMDRSIRVVNHRHRSVAAVNRIGDLSCIHHQSAKLYHDGTVTEAAIYWQRRVRMSSDGIVFAYGVPCFLLSPSHGLMQTTHTFQDLSRDMSVTVLFTSRGYGPHLVELLEALVRNAHYDYHEDGSVTVEINKCLIKQAPNGDVTVSSDDYDKLIRVSPENGSVCVNTNFCEMSIQMNYNIKVKRGTYRLNASYNGLVVSDGLHDSGFTSSQRPFLRPAVSTTHTIIKDGKRVVERDGDLLAAAAADEQRDSSRSASALSIQSCYRFDRHTRYEPRNGAQSSLSHQSMLAAAASSPLPASEPDSPLLLERQASYTPGRLAQPLPDRRLNPYSFWNEQLQSPLGRRALPGLRRRLTYAHDDITLASEALSDYQHDGVFSRKVKLTSAACGGQQEARQSRSSRHCDAATPPVRILQRPSCEAAAPRRQQARPERIDFSCWYPPARWQQRPKRQYKLGRAHVYPPPGNEATKKRFYGYITSSCTTLKPRDCSENMDADGCSKDGEATSSVAAARSSSVETDAKLMPLREFSQSFIADTINNAANVMDTIDREQDIIEIAQALKLLNVQDNTSDSGDVIERAPKQVLKHPSTSCCVEEASDVQTDVPLSARSKSMPYISIRPEWRAQQDSSRGQGQSLNTDIRGQVTGEGGQIASAGKRATAESRDEAERLLAVVGSAADTVGDKGSGAGEGVSVKATDDGAPRKEKTQKRRSKKQRQR